MECLLAYDISSPRRLGRLFRYLKTCALPIQYSVFYFQGDARKMQKIVDQARTYIDEKQDDFRVYPLPTRGFRARLGKNLLPENVFWSGMPITWYTEYQDSDEEDEADDAPQNPLTTDEKLAQLGIVIIDDKLK